MDYRVSICMARLLRHVNTSPQRFKLVVLPLVLRVRMDQGPNTSKPTLVNGGVASILSAGKSAIRCSTGGPRNFLQTTQRLSSLATV